MRSCDEIVELISASLDGELSADEQIALDEHIACCPACSALLDDLRALHTAAADWEEVPAPAGFTEAVMSAIAAETEQEKPDNVIPFAAPKKATRTYRKQWGVTAAAVAVVVLGAVSAPSLLGNFNATKAESMADMAYAREDSLAEVAMDQAMDQVMPQASAYTESEEMDANTEAKGSVKEEAPTEAVSEPEYQHSAATAPQNPAENPTYGEKPKAELYVGELILEGPLEMLEESEGAACSDGTVTYLVSADLFAEVLKVLEAEKPVGYTYTAGSADAQLGKIIVQSN